MLLRSMYVKICYAAHFEILPNNNRRRPRSIIEDDEKMECANVMDLIEQDTTFRSNWATVRYYPQISQFKDYYAENSEKCKDYIECVKKMFALGRNKKARFRFFNFNLYVKRLFRNDALDIRLFYR